MNEHCYNCLNTEHCANYGKGDCAYKGKPLELFEGRYCKKECFVCKFESECVASCKGQVCSKCRFYERTCKGQ